jgi:uncharacterized protein (TIGR03437 family)
MKSRLCLIGVLSALLPTYGWTDSSSYQLTGSTDILTTVYAFRPQWSPDGQWIVYDDHESGLFYGSNSYKVYRMHPDGSGTECLTCERSEVPHSSGGAQIDPSGRYVVFTAEQANHMPLFGTGTDPGGGIFNDVAVLDLQLRTITRVHVVGSGLGESAGGSLFPRFSHSGTKIAWGDYINKGDSESKFGAWQVVVADFVPSPTPHLENLRYFTPGPRPDIYEIQGWTPDDSALVMSCAPLPGQNDNALDITQMDLATGQLKQLTFTAGVNGQPAEYEEHAEISPGGDALAFMSSMGYGIDPNSFFITWLKSELWLANADGTQTRQLTFFNVPGNPGYTGQRVIVSMLSWAPDGSGIVANVYYYPDASHEAISKITVFHFATPPPTVGAAIFASDFGGYAAAAPGSFVEIYGNHMAGKTDNWSRHFVAGKAPTALDSVTVTIGGVPAYVNFVSPLQVNIQVPAQVETGGSLPVVLTYNGHSTAPVMLAINALEPGLLAPALFKVNGVQYAAAFHANNTIVGNGKVPNIPTTPAKPDETIVFYGVGFGAAKDLTGRSLPLAGQIITAQNQLTNPVAFQFGNFGAPGIIMYAGMAMNYTGLYQFNVKVPANAPDGDLPLTVTLGGNKLAQTLFISVHK